MITKFYKWMAAGTVTSLLLATLAVAPVAAQSSSENGQSSDQSQGQEMNQDQGMNQDNNQNGNNGQNGNGQNQGQGSCVAFAQSMGQGMSQGNNQNGNNGQATLGTGPGNAATPMANCWLSIGPGQKQWYKFHVGARSNKGDENNNFDNANGVDDSDAAIAELTMDTQGCIAFEIWTQERLTAAQNGVKDDDKLLGPVGAGSPEFVINKNNDNSSDNSSSNNNASSANSDKNLNRGRLLWRGGSTVREDFLLVVRNLRSDSTCSYRLSVAGPTVSFPGANNGNNNANGSNNGNSGNNNNGNNGNNNNGSNNGSSNGNNNNG